MKLARRTYLEIILSVIFFWVATVIVFAFTTRYSVRGGRWGSIIATFAAIVLTLLLTFVFVRWQKLTLKDVGILPSNKSTSKFFLGIIIGSLLGFLHTVPAFISGHLRLQTNHGIDATQITLTCMLLLLLAYREELVFRGYALKSLNITGGPLLAIAVTAILFIIEHIIGGMSWQMAIWGSGLGAVLFGIAAVQSNGLALPVGIHAAWNITQWILGFKNEAGPFHTVIDKGFETSLQTIGTISYIFWMLAAIAIFYFTGKRNSLPKNL